MSWLSRMRESSASREVAAPTMKRQFPSYFLFRVFVVIAALGFIQGQQDQLKVLSLR